MFYEYNMHVYMPHLTPHTTMIQHNVHGLYARYNSHALSTLNIFICSTHICHGDSKAMTFCTGKTGILGVRALRAWVRPCKHHSVSITGRKSNSQQCVANCGCLGCDVISNVWEMAYAVIRSRIRHDPEV